jgi:hypothetical protein
VDVIHLMQARYAISYYQVIEMAPDPGEILEQQPDDAPLA